MDPKKISLSRRHLLGGGLLTFAAFLANQVKNVISLKPVGSSKPLISSKNLGHALRDQEFKLNSDSALFSTDTLIVGGGISGLSAGWWLNKHKNHSFQILEMESEVGGNSIGGKNTASEFPLGAHYVPTPGPEAVYVRKLFQELDILSPNPQGTLEYNEQYLVHDPEERLFIQGRWQEGLMPQFGLNKIDQQELTRFKQLMDYFKTTRGNDLKKAFAVPVAESSADPKFTRLDGILFSDWLQQEKFVGAGQSNQPLQWYLNYCCLDDFGATIDRISAWAGIHYFASRQSSQILTWPEGNYFLVKKLRTPLQSHIHCERTAFKIEQKQNLVEVSVANTKTHKTEKWQCKNLILATPQFINERLLPLPSTAQDRHPWVVANLTLQEALYGPRGAPLSWDNVFYGSSNLGYVSANHQNLKLPRGNQVITFYLVFAPNLKPKEARLILRTTTPNDLKEMILSDLRQAHTDIEDLLIDFQTKIWGHAMPSPAPGFLNGIARKRGEHSSGRIHFANSDLTGFSTFEEAQYWGVTAAKRISL